MTIIVATSTPALLRLQHYLYAAFPALTSRAIARVSQYVYRHFVPRKRALPEKKL